MSNLTWKYVKELKDKQSVKKYLAEKGISLDSKLIETIETNNGGRPSSKVFDTSDAKERMFKSLLSYNKDDLETIFDNYNDENDIKKNGLFPFAIDPAGSYICVDLKDNSIVYFDTDVEKKELIAKTFAEFLNMLY